MCQDNTGSSIVGASVAYISSNWTLEHKALMVKRHNGGHGAQVVASTIQEFTSERFNFDAVAAAKFVMSDTTGTFHINNLVVPKKK